MVTGVFWILVFDTVVDIFDVPVFGVFQNVLLFDVKFFGNMIRWIHEVNNRNVFQLTMWFNYVNTDIRWCWWQVNRGIFKVREFFEEGFTNFQVILKEARKGDVTCSIKVVAEVEEIANRVFRVSCFVGFWFNDRTTQDTFSGFKSHDDTTVLHLFLVNASNIDMSAPFHEVFHIASKGIGNDFIRNLTKLFGRDIETPWHFVFQNKLNQWQIVVINVIADVLVVFRFGLSVIFV